ncbi:hypothetical protein M6B38_248655 [Iris pallida]|uniref:Uncharacterized protein n=1 Tax=Iris pallida TaxID=29817 RepID=A0AAX6DFR2_IRIPA|nr:hypothetical protein M6B38_248655 [Iris pallida]
MASLLSTPSHHLLSLDGLSIISTPFRVVAFSKVAAPTNSCRPLQSRSTTSPVDALGGYLFSLDFPFLFLIE